MYSLLYNLKFLIENIIGEDVFLSEDLSIVNILYSRIDGERKQMLRLHFLYGKHFHRNFYRYWSLCVIGLVILMMLIYGCFSLVSLINGSVVIISSGLIFYWRFSTEIFDTLKAFRLNFEVQNFVRTARCYTHLTRIIVKFQQNYENTLSEHFICDNESSPYQFMMKSWKQTTDAARIEQVAVIKELLRNIQYLVKYAGVSEEFESCFLDNMQQIIVENLLLSELRDLFLLLQSNFFLVLVLSLCNRVNLQSDSTLKQLVVNLNCMIRDSNRKLKSDYENMKLLLEPVSKSEPSEKTASKPNKCSIANTIEWIANFFPKMNDERAKKSNAINFEKIKFRKVIFDLIVKFKVTHSVILNMEQISRKMVNENKEENDAKGESINLKRNQIEKNLTLLNNLFSECKNLITLLNANYLKSLKQQSIVRDMNDDTELLQRSVNQIPSINENQIIVVNENEITEDQVFEIRPTRSNRKKSRNCSRIVVPVERKQNAQFLNELKQKLKSRESDWNKREQIALEKNNSTVFSNVDDTIDEMQSEDEVEDKIDESVNNDENNQEIADMIAINTAWSKLVMSRCPPPTPEHEVFTANDNDYSD